MINQRHTSNKTSRDILCCVMFYFFSALSFHCIADEDNTYKQERLDANKKLSAVQKEISKQKINIKHVNEKRQKIEQQLKQDDLAIASSIKRIKNTQAELSLTKKDITKLRQQKSTLEQEKKQQQGALAKQLRAAYSTGNHDYLKLILNQEDASTVQRTVTYYQYVNKARMKEIDQFQSTITELISVSEKLEQQAENLNVLVKQQKHEKQILEGNKALRNQTVRALKKELLTKQQQLSKLSAEENNLVSALQKLADLANSIPQVLTLEGLSKLKKQLAWPVKARIKHRFGSVKKEYLKWKGVLMSAPQGREVKTIHNGTVLFSDWLKGYGLVTVIDHGQGYMSLYGHNQALLKNVGDQVETGEPIALVGQSGGQESSGLYFEIRHRGKAMNPKLWCR